MVRLENLDDKFDLKIDHTQAHINLEKLAIQLFQNINNLKPISIKFEELDLQGVHVLSGARKAFFKVQGQSEL